MNITTCRKTMENVRNSINVSLINNKKDYLKPISISHTIFENDFSRNM